MLIIPAAAPSFQNGTAYISLEDVTYADALSETVAECTISGVRHTQGGSDTKLSFSLRVPTGSAVIDLKRDYVVQAWINCAADGLMRKGDLVSDQVYRVLTGGFGSTATIILRQI